MGIPNKAYGYGLTNANVFGFVVDYPLSSVIKYSAYDNDQTFPTTATLTTTANRVLRGSTVNGDISMVSIYDTTDHAPATADWTQTWYASTAGQNANRVAGGFDSGTDHYVEQLGSIASPSVSGSYDSSPNCTFQMLCAVPSDTETTDNMNFDLAVQFTYTSTAPTPKFQFNDSDAGTETSPSWVDIAGNGIRHTAVGATSTAPYANIPASGIELTAAGWIMSS